MASAARPGSSVARPTATNPLSAARPNLPYIGLSAASIRPPDRLEEHVDDRTAAGPDGMRRSTIVSTVRGWSDAAPATAATDGDDRHEHERTGCRAEAEPRSAHGVGQPGQGQVAGDAPQRRAHDVRRRSACAQQERREEQQQSDRLRGAGRRKHRSEQHADARERQRAEQHGCDEAAPLVRRGHAVDGRGDGEQYRRRAEHRDEPDHQLRERRTTSAGSRRGRTGAARRVRDTRRGAPAA